MMNSMELSVRSMAVDFLVSLISGIYREHASIESISLCMLTVLPEVVAREVALCSASGLIKSMEDAESSLWPLRRALADVEETNPLDDDRVDPQLLPSLTTFCRTGQAIIDGVLVEMRLRMSSDFDLVELMSKAKRSSPPTGKIMPLKMVFDADEESVLEAASFFSHETSLFQKLRWLFTLRDLHVAKRQWSEVAATLILCAHSLINSLDHLTNVWRPSRFELWNDYRRSPWLSSVGLSGSQGNIAVMEFANGFLEPVIFQQKGTIVDHHISVERVCLTLINVIDQVEAACVEEGGMEDIACSHLEELLNMVTATINSETKMYHAEARAALRRVRANICSKLAKLTEHDAGKSLTRNQGDGQGDQSYVLALIHGNKPKRFQESTTIPTFLEWDTPSVCRVSKPAIVEAARRKEQNPTESWDNCICRTFAKPLIEALRTDDDNHSVVLRTRETRDVAIDETKTYVSVVAVNPKGRSIKPRKFFVRHGEGITEYTVARKFPHALSRQRSLMTSELSIMNRH
jgi:hypothetical protein